MNKKDNQIDIIIPAYKAHKTIIRTLCSITEQTILKDLHVTIVNDACPEGSYQDIINIFKEFVDIKEICLETNGGPGVARQEGIDKTTHEFFTCIDADDTFAGSIALEVLRAGITEQPIFQCASATFLQLGESLKQIVPHPNDMVWMFGKLYRREFIERYKVRFNNTRANEDTGFNTMVRLLCDNPREQLRFIPEAVYYWHNKPDSITRINEGQYALDQCFCGWTDNMIYAIKHVKKIRPFSGSVTQWIVNVMMQLYYYYIETVAKKPVFADQNWEYVKKFYHSCYKKIEEDISEQVFSEMFSMCSMEKHKSGSLIGFVPCMGIKEFMERLKQSEYNEDDIYAVWDKIPLELRENNVTCGVCPDKYWEKIQ